MDTTRKIIIGLLVVVVAVCCALLLFGRHKEPSHRMDHTVWISDHDGSEVVFTEDRIDWYLDAKDHGDNYCSGTFSFYMGEDAVRYLTEDLAQYGITQEEVLSLVVGSDRYSVKDLVVFDLRYDKIVADGAEHKIEQPMAPWFGFLLDEGTRLDVCNMQTGGYYSFTKKSDGP